MKYDNDGDGDGGGGDAPSPSAVSPPSLGLDLLFFLFFCPRFGHTLPSVCLIFYFIYI